MIELVRQVYKWSVCQTSESHKFEANNYYWTQPIKTVLFRLQNTEKALLGIQGLQGTGKSAALSALENSFPEENVILWKWRRDWEQGFFDEVTVWDEYWERLWLAAADNEEIRRKLGLADVKTMSMELDVWKKESNELHPTKINVFTGDRMTYKESRKAMLDERANSETLEKLLGSATVQSIKRGFMNSYLFKAKAIFIDMPDYNKTNLQLMSKDIDELQHMWNEFMKRSYKTSFVVSVQKEIVMKKPHYFFGKVMWVDLEPLTAEQLLEAYVQRWQSFEPFTEDALKFIAKLSRGVFRRFLKYVNLTIEGFMVDAKSTLISVEDVEKVISSKILLNDMELELSDIFSNSQHRIQAVRVFDMLRSGSLTQKEIAENLGVSEAVVGKFVTKLELYNYVKKTRSKEAGYGWEVSLA